MKITTKRNKNLVEFKTIKDSECFLDMNRDLFMKVPTIHILDDEFNALMLEGGTILRFDNEEPVEKVNVTAVIEEE